MSFICSIPFAASLFSACAGPAPLAVGYVEGDYVLLAPIEVAQVQSISVKRGDRVEAGTAIAEMETDDAKIAVAQAEAALAQAQAQLADLKLGRRPEEIAVLDAMVRSAKARGGGETARIRAGDRSARPRHRHAGGVRCGADGCGGGRGADQPGRSQSRGRQSCRRAPRRSRRPRTRSSRPGRRSSRRNGGCRSARSRRRPPGRVDDVIRNPGDVAGPSAPVISMLPDGAVKLTLFVPEPSFSSVEVGKILEGALRRLP